MRQAADQSVNTGETTGAEATVMKVLWALSCAHLINDILQALLPSIYPLLKESYHLSFTQIGLITLTYQVIGSLLQPLVGFYTDRHHQPYSLAVGMGATLGGLVLLSQASSFAGLCVGAATVGVGAYPERQRFIEIIPFATEELLALAQQILPQPHGERPLIVADSEHFTVELFDHIRTHTPFDLLAPLPQTAALQETYRALPSADFRPHWAGFGIATQTFQPRRSASEEPCYRYIQRTGERPQDYHFKGFACTRARCEVPTLTRDFPDRWHIEEFYRFEQDLGWKRAGTLNLNVRAGQMSLALVTQALIHQLRQRLGEPFATWDSRHLAKDLFSGLEGDLRVERDTLVVTYYNAPNAGRWKEHFENLPRQLEKAGVDPKIPWLYNFKLDFRFK